MKVALTMSLALTIGHAEARRRLLASQKKDPMANIQNLQEYYGTGTIFLIMLKGLCQDEGLEASLRKSLLHVTEHR